MDSFIKYVSMCEREDSERLSKLKTSKKSNTDPLSSSSEISNETSPLIMQGLRKGSLPPKTSSKKQSANSKRVALPSPFKRRSKSYNVGQMAPKLRKRAIQKRFGYRKRSDSSALDYGNCRRTMISRSFDSRLSKYLPKKPDIRSINETFTNHHQVESSNNTCSTPKKSFIFKKKKKIKLSKIGLPNSISPQKTGSKIFNCSKFSIYRKKRKRVMTDNAAMDLLQPRDSSFNMINRIKNSICQLTDERKIKEKFQNAKKVRSNKIRIQRFPFLSPMTANIDA